MSAHLLSLTRVYFFGTGIDYVILNTTAYVALACASASVISELRDQALQSIVAQL